MVGSFAKGEALAAIIRSHTCRTFSVKSMAELREVREKGWECTIWFVWGSWFPGTAGPSYLRKARKKTQP